MKNWMILALFIASMGSAFAQQTTPNTSPTVTADQTTSPVGDATASGKEPLQTRHGDFWDGDEPGVAALLSHPFASKAYVRRNLEPIRDRVNELEELTASQAKTIKNVDSSAQHGIQMASDKAKEADQQATEAGNKAQNAQELATKAITRLSMVEPIVSNVEEYKTANQTEIRFPSGRSDLSKDAKRSLDELAASVKDQHGYVIEVQGFSSGHGQAAIAASRRMADSVVRYMVVEHEVPAYRVYVIGMGNVSVKEGEREARHTRGGRAEISVLKNNLDQGISNSTSGATSTPK